MWISEVSSPSILLDFVVRPRAKQTGFKLGQDKRDRRQIACPVLQSDLLSVTAPFAKNQFKYTYLEAQPCILEMLLRLQLFKHSFL